MDIEKSLIQAATGGNLKILKHICETSLIPKNQRLNVFENNLEILLDTPIRKMKKEVLDYLLKIEEIKQQKEKLTDIFSNQFAKCAGFSVLSRMRFLNENYKIYIDYAYSNYWVFRSAYKNNNMDVLKFLIFELGLNESIKDVKECVEFEPTKKETKNACLSWFKNKKTNDFLNNNLPKKEFNSLNKIKV